MSVNHVNKKLTRKVVLSLGEESYQSIVESALVEQAKVRLWHQALLETKYKFKEIPKPLLQYCPAPSIEVSE